MKINQSIWINLPLNSQDWTFIIIQLSNIVATTIVVLWVKQPVQITVPNVRMQAIFQLRGLFKSYRYIADRNNLRLKNKKKNSIQRNQCQFIQNNICQNRHLFALFRSLRASSSRLLHPLKEFHQSIKLKQKYQLNWCKLS